MVKGLCASNCLALFAYFRRHTLPTLLDALERAMAEVGRTFAEAVQAPGFLRLTCEEVCTILARDDLAAAREDVILAAAVAWLQARGEAVAEEVTTAVLDCVRWPLVSVAGLLAFEAAPVAAAYVHFREQFTRALKWHAVQSVGDGTTRAALARQVQDSKHAEEGGALFRARAYVPPVPPASPVPST